MISAAGGTADTPRAHITNMAAIGMKYIEYNGLLRPSEAILVDEYARQSVFAI